MTPRAAFIDDQATAGARGMVDATAATADATARLVNASLDLERRREAERHERTKRYRQAVARAADNGGRLPEPEIEQLMEDCQALGFPSDAFANDLSAMWEDREQEQKIAAARARGSEAQERYAAATKEHKATQAKFSEARDEAERLTKLYNAEMMVIDRRMGEADRQATLALREAGRIEDKQHVERSRHPRLWG
jgi:hypothetical protein